MFVNRLTRLLARRRRARHFGFHYRRGRDFELPGKIRIDGQEFTLRAPNQIGMRAAFADVLLDDCYGLNSYSRRCIKSVLDIGGSVGFFSLAARDALPSAVIHVYEPNPAVLPDLNANLEMAACEVFAEAVGASAGYVGLIDNAELVLVRARADSGDIPRAAFSTAIERMGGHCDLVKLDCEGAEWEILTDIESWRNVDHLTMEYHLWHENHRHEDMIRLVADLGFVISRQTPVHHDCGILWASRKV